MSTRFTGKKIVVIGGTSGIGLRLADRLQHEGANVTVASRSEANRANARDVLGAQADIRTLDVTSESGVAAFFSGFPAIDHLVMTAAVAAAGPFLEQPVSAVRDLVESKFWGQFYGARYAAPKIPEGGSITLFSGIVARKPLAGMSAFASVAGAIESLTRVLALELAPVRINCITPGVVETPAWSFLPEPDRSRQLEAIGASLPVKRVGGPEDVADAAMMVMANGFMTGAVVDVDGGHHVL